MDEKLITVTSPLLPSLDDFYLIYKIFGIVNG